MYKLEKGVYVHHNVKVISLRDLAKLVDQLITEYGENSKLSAIRSGVDHDVKLVVKL